MPAALASHKSTTVPLLATRFFLPPLPAVCITRPRLFALLERGLRLPVTLVCAPPGFGKSSLVREWVGSQANLQTGWLSLEATDQDWGLFFRYLVGAWQRIFPRAGETALAEFQAAPSPDRQLLATLLLNDLLAGIEQVGQAMLVLDDYHRIESAEIHETVTYLVEHLPPGCHLALLTRADPPLPVTRWRSRGQVLEVRVDDLRFTSSEAVEYFDKSVHLKLDEAQIDVLRNRTEGWIVGLQMAALALQGPIVLHGAPSMHGLADIQAFVDDFGGSNRFVVDYLVEEVVRQQPDEIQQFLLVTALLNRFCGPLCDALLETDAPYSQQLLERLEKANLFLIPLDDRRYWFRYHHLFADLLRVRLRQTHPEQISVLYQRGAKWFAQNHLWRDAIQCGLQSKDIEFSAALFEQAVLNGGLDFLNSGMRPLIEPFPASIVENRPLLSLAKAVAIFESSQIDGLEPLLRFAEQSIQSALPFPGQKNLLGWIYVIQSRAAALMGDPDWMLEASQQILRLIPEDRLAYTEALIHTGSAFYYQGDLNQTVAFWQQALDVSQVDRNTYLILSLLNGLGRICFLKGELNRAEGFFRRGLDLLAEHPDQYLIWLGAMQRDYSDVFRERNRLEDAQALMTSALPLCEKWHTISAYGCALIYMARVRFTLGDLSGAHEMLNKADEIRRTHTIYPDLETLAQVTRARLYLEEDEADRAWQMLENCLRSNCCRHELHREWVLIGQARILVRTGRPDEALALLGGSLERAQANGRARNWLLMCLIAALAHNSLENQQRAFQLLRDGLEFALAEGHRRALIEEGEPMRALLEGFRVHFPQSPFVETIGEILSHFPVKPGRERGYSIPLEGLVETLSHRELEILRLVCQGLSNQEIARQLVLSVGTVKFHVHNIFGKLGVRDRPQAIAKAIQLGL